MEEDVEAINGLKHLLDFYLLEPTLFSGDRSFGGPVYGKSGAETCSANPLSLPMQMMK
jgi:hypothetical protein